MHRLGLVVVVGIGGLLAVACSGKSPFGLVGPSSGGPPLGSTGDDAGAVDDSGPSPDAIVTGDDGATPPPPPPPPTPPLDGGGVGIDAGAPCYSEPYDPAANLADLASSYTGSSWLSDALQTMKRRYPTGYFVLSAMQSDPQLPQFADASSWSALMASMWSMLNAETGGWEFNQASATAHPFVITDALTISAPILPTWQQGEILQYIHDASTQQWDQIELQGQEGSYDGVFLFDDMNSAFNGLAAATAVGNQLTAPIPARDDAAAHLYYLELYLRDGRTAHAAQYAALKSDASWQKLVRYEWARGHFWDGQAKPNANLGQAAAPIWTHIDDAANLAEIQQFTGESPDLVACHP